MILLSYKLLFYKLYIWNLKRFGKSDFPELNSLLLVSIFTFVNLITVVLLTDIIGNTDLFSILTSNNFVVIIIAIVNLLLNHLFLTTKGKYANTILEIENISKDQVRRHSRFLWMYFIFSFLLFGFVIVFVIT